MLDTDDEGDVGGDPAGKHVPLLAEGDLGARVPAGFDIDRENLLLSSKHTISGKDLPRSFHLLFSPC